jgi:uncharacterized membrane protein YeaQ/YmgE (transglycosylase-associated protein family)
MSFLGFIVLVIVASICGSIGSRIAGYGARGCLTSTIVGLVGAMIGTWLSRQMGVRDFFYLAGIPVLWSIVGSVIFVVLIGVFAGKSGHR